LSDGGATTPSQFDESDPLARKLELADEFRQIGDMEGARDLLEEVVAKSSGALRSKAQAMLDALG
jgi:pilus assembly protein FimV